MLLLVRALEFKNFALRVPHKYDVVYITFEWHTYILKAIFKHMATFQPYISTSISLHRSVNARTRHDTTDAIAHTHTTRPLHNYTHEQ